MEHSHLRKALIPNKIIKNRQENDYFIYGGNKFDINNLKKRNNNKNLFLKESLPYAGLSKIMMKMDILTIPYTKKVESAGGVDDISKYTSPLKLFDYLAVGKIIITPI